MAGTCTKSDGFDTIGSFGRSGVWLVGDCTGKGAFLRGDKLPAEGTGYQYYYLGANQGQANPRIPQALGALNIVTDQIPLSAGKAFTGGSQNLNFDLLPPIGTSKSQFGNTVNQAGQAATSATNAAKGAVSGLASAANFIFSLQFLYILGGFALLLMALVLIAKKIK